MTPPWSNMTISPFKTKDTPLDSVEELEMQYKQLCASKNWNEAIDCASALIPTPNSARTTAPVASVP